MLRRRLSPLGRQAAQVAYDCQQAATRMPVIFASRYGDAARSLELLRHHAADEALSPTDFALSVHNAIGAMYSIARADGSNYSAVAAGRATVAAALVDAAGQLDDGADEVLLVCYDAPLPGAYAAFADEPSVPFAWAWRVTQPQPGAASFSLSVACADGQSEADAGALPFGLDVMRFALSQDRVMRRSVDGQCWTWRRHG